AVLLKGADPTRLLDAIRGVARVDVIPTRAPRRTSPVTGRSAKRGDSAVVLTLREVEVLRLVARGMTDAKIAASLALSVNTAANHVRNVMAKLGAESRPQAALSARDHRLL